MTILALDLGTTVGWASLDDSGALTWGHVQLQGDEGERYAAFRRWLLARLAELHGDGFVAFEEVRFNRGRSYIPGQIAILMAVCVEADVAYVGVGVPELKRWATGKGNAKKPAMVAAARRWARTDLTDDEADALLVARWAHENALIQEAP